MIIHRKIVLGHVCLCSGEVVAKERTRRIGREPQVGITIKTFLRCFKFWHVWLFASALTGSSFVYVDHVDHA